MSWCLCTHLVEDRQVGSMCQSEACDVHLTEIRKAADGLLPFNLMRRHVSLLVITC